MSEEQRPERRTPEAAPSRPLGQAWGGDDRAGHLGFVAHEVRNPLATALWSAELLTRLAPEERAGERGLKLAGLVARALVRLQGLMEDHLLCERLDAGGYPLRLGPVGLAVLVAAAQERLQLEPPPVVSLGPGLAGQGDRALLERAVEGLMAAAASGGAPVRITGQLGGGMVRIAISGAPAGSLADPVKGSMSDPSGRALSLPLARRIAELMGGTLTAGGEGYLLDFPAT